MTTIYYHHYNNPEINNLPIILLSRYMLPQLGQSFRAVKKQLFVISNSQDYQNGQTDGVTGSTSAQDPKSTTLIAYSAL